MSHTDLTPDEEIFRLIFERHAAIMLLIDPEKGIVLDANKAAVDFYGYPKPELCGMAVDKINTLPADEIAVELEKSVTVGQNYYVFSHKLASGEVRTVEVHSSPIVFREMQLIFSIIHDITERRQVETALRESEEKFRNIVEYAADGIVLTDEDGLVVEWNPAQAKIVGLTHAEAVGQPLWDIQFRSAPVAMQTPAVYEKIKAFFQEVLASGKVPDELARENEGKIQNPAGSLRTIRSKTFTVETARGFRLAGISRDVTQRKQAEDILRESEEKYRAVANFTYDWEVWRDPDGACLYISQSCERISGYAAAQFLADKHLIVKIAHPDDRERVAAHFDDSVQQFGDDDVQFDFRIITANGETRWLSHHCSAIYAEDGKWLGRRESNRDITQRKKAESELRQRTDELEVLRKTILEISSPHQLPELLNLIVERAANLLNASSGGLYLVEAEQRKVRCVVSYKTKGDFTGTLLDFGVGAAGIVADTGQPLIIDDYSKWAGRAAVYDEGQPFQAVMSAPMLWQGQVRGVLHILRDDRSNKFTQGELNLLLMFANHAAVAVENAHLVDLLQCELFERKQAEDLLEKTHRNYETFFNTVDDFLFVLDEQGNIIYTNETVRQRLGYSAEELIGRSVLAMHPPERQEEAGRIVGEMLAGRAEYCPVPLMTKSGEQIPVETRVTLGVWDAKPVIFGVTKDISQIKLSEEKFSKAFQANSALMALSRFEDGTYIDVNDVFLQTLGFARDELIGKTSVELKLFADPAQRDRLIKILKQNKSVKDVEVTVRAKNGSLRYGLFSADSIYIGKDLCLLTVMVDMTERRRAEAALRESQLLYHSLVEVSPLSICRKDLAGRFTFANARFLELSNTTLDELVGKTDYELHPAALAEKYRSDDQAVMSSEQIKELIEERSLHDGETSIVQSIKTPIYDGAGKVNGVQISF